MSDTDFLKDLIRRGESADKGYFHYAHLVAVLLDDSLHESLRQLINGPVWDGDVVSKSRRDELISLGLATRICCKGEQGYTGATYFAYSVMKIAKEGGRMTTYHIKPLEWKVNGAGFCSANTPFGRYEVFDYYAGNHAALFYYKSSNFGNNLLQNNGHSLDYAKAVCEDHWESLMKRALEEV